MEWLKFAFLMPCLAAMNSVIDQAIVKQHFGLNRANMIFRTGISYFLPAAILISISVFNSVHIPGSKILFLLGLGTFWTAALIPYLHGLQKGNASIVTAIFNTIPLMTFLFAWAFLDEKSSWHQVLAAGLIVLAATAISFDLKKWRLNSAALGYSVIASGMYSVYIVALRHVAIGIPTGAIVGCIMMGSSLATFIFLSCAAKQRVEFIAVCRNSSTRLFCIFAIQLCIATFAHLVTVRGLQVGPSAGMVNTVWNLQPAIVLLYLILAGSLFPRIYDKIPFDKSLVWHLGCLVIIFGGLALLLG